MSQHTDEPEMQWIEIIPCIHGKVTADGKLSEPDIYWILERWLERHPEVQARSRDIRISRGCITTREGARTELVRVTIVDSGALQGYDPSRDRDLYEYYLAERDA